MGKIFSIISCFLISLFSKQQSIDIKNLSGNFDPRTKNAIFSNKPVPMPSEDYSKIATKVLGSSNSSDKHIEVDLTNQRIIAIDGGSELLNFPISSGKWGATPAGTFTTWVKLKYTLMKGGSKALGTYYYLPNVPYTMYFYNEDYQKSLGYGIHGAYWHNNFGHPMSHGCINMRPEDAKALFYWANPPISEKDWGKYASEEDPGTTVLIYGEAPKE